MKLSFREWAVFFCISLIGFGIWYKFGYPKFLIIDLSLDKAQAVKTAENFLESRGIDYRKYSRSVVFSSDWLADIYLQRVLGRKGSEQFIKRQGYELFFWRVRFFKELRKEEYLLDISSKTGKIINYDHEIEDVEPREKVSKDAAKEKAGGFLGKSMRTGLEDFDFHGESAIRYDNRIDHVFSWEKKGVYIPWGEEAGGAKLLSGATVSGSEIRSFYLGRMDVPERFRRYVEEQSALGEYVSRFAYLLLIGMVMLAIVLVLQRKQSVLMGISYRWYVGLALFLAAVNFAVIFNNLQQIFNSYPTSVSLSSYIGLYIQQAVMNLIFLAAAFTLPGLAGESIWGETFPKSKFTSFLYFIRSTFWGRSMARSVFLGYIVFFIMLGLQAALFELGQKYLGVWEQKFKLIQFSSAYIPFFSAFAVGATAALSEEVIFRLFGIGWLTKYLKNTALAVFLSALIWGFGHTQYAIFPVWFRGVEVSLLGIFMGFVFVRYGIVCLIVAHYLFDVFWGSAPYILGSSTPQLFISSLTIILLPLGFGVLVFFLNRPEQEREIKVALNRAQEYNLRVLSAFAAAKRSEGIDRRQLREELVGYGWDHTLVDLALEKVFGSV